MSRVSRETQEAFEELLGELPPPKGNWQAGPAARQEALELHALSEQLSVLRDVNAPAELRRTALQRAFATPLPTRRKIFPRPFLDLRSWTFVASRASAALLAVILLAYGTVVSSAASLPDSPLYPVKLLVEDVQFALAPSSDRPKLYSEQAVRRLDETKALIDDGRIPEAVQTANAAGQSIELARAAAEQSSSPQDAQAVIAATTDPYQSVLAALEAHGVAPSVVLAQVPGPDSHVKAAQATPQSRSGASQTPVVAPSATATRVAQSVAAPLPSGGFTAIEESGANSSPTEMPSGSSSSMLSPTSSPTAAPVDAPSSGFVAIGEPTRTADPAPAITTTAQPPALSVSFTATPTPTQQRGFSTPTETATARSTPTSSPIASATAGMATPTATSGLRAPSDGFTPIVLPSSPAGGPP